MLRAVLRRVIAVAVNYYAQLSSAHPPPPSPRAIVTLYPWAVDSVVVLRNRDSMASTKPIPSCPRHAFPNHAVRAPPLRRASSISKSSWPRSCQNHGHLQMRRQHIPVRVLPPFRLENVSRQSCCNLRAEWGPDVLEADWDAAPGGHPAWAPHVRLCWPSEPSVHVLVRPPTPMNEFQVCAWNCGAPVRVM